MPEPEELIELRTKKEGAGEVDYPETTETLSMRNDLARYNQFVKQHDISVHLDGDVEVSNRFLLDFLQQGISNNTITLEAVVWDSEVSGTPNQTPVAYNSSHPYPNPYTLPTTQYTPSYSMTGTRSENSLSF